VRWGFDRLVFAIYSGKNCLNLLQILLAMEAEILREKLHEYINVADEQHLTAIYTLVEDSIPFRKDEMCDEATMNMLYERRENHRKGISKSYTVEESIDFILQHKKKK